MGEEELTVESQESIPPKPEANLPKIKWWQLIAGSLMMICLMIWSFIFMDKLMMPFAVRKGVEVTVPNLYLMSFIEADSISSGDGLQIQRGRQRIDKSLPAGIIVDQFPVAGTIVKPGKRIEVVYTIESEVILCPELIGRSPREASLIADSLNLFVDNTKTLYAHSERYPDGVVIRQVPEAMMSMMDEDTIRLVVSVGPVPTEIRAPMLVGQKLNEIQRLLVKHKLRRGKVTRFPDSSVPPSTILSQDPEFGTLMKSGDRINIQVAIKPKPAVEEVEE